MKNLGQHYSRTRAETPQTQPIPGRTDMVVNSAGGYVWPVDDWQRLRRWLILGSDKGTYYVGVQDFTRQSADAVNRCIETDGKKTVQEIVDISQSGAAASNDYALFALAMACAATDLATRHAALDAIPLVARIGTHLFTFLNYAAEFRGWGTAFQRSVGEWYNDKTPRDLAYQLIKYRQRVGWTHKDVLRKAHVLPVDKAHDLIYRWVTQGELPVGPEEIDVDGLIWAFEKAQRTTNALEIVNLIRHTNLPWEAIPQKFHKEPSVWEALLMKMPITATIRNLSRLTNLGVIGPFLEGSQIVIDRVTSRDQLKRGRVHPIAMLNAFNAYRKGEGRHMMWTPVQQVVDALNEGFYLSFDAIEPSNKRFQLALDISGSMSWELDNLNGMNCREAAAVMAMVTARTEPQYMITAFASQLMVANVSPTQRLDDVIKTVNAWSFGSTDCSLPMVYALKNKIPTDVFVVYTDAETWSGRGHPAEALQRYRREMNIPAKLIVVAMTSTGFTIADPEDLGMLDVVGFDTRTPNVISNFSADRF